MNNKTTKGATTMQNKTTQIAEFNGIKMDIIKQKDDFYLTADQIGDALEYSDPRISINNIYNRNKELLDEYSTVIKLMTQGQKRNIRVFNEEGAMIIAMKSNKPKAIAFQKWAVKVLKQHRLGQISTPNNTQAQNLPTQTKLAPVDTVNGNSLIRLDTNQQGISTINTVQLSKVFIKSHDKIVSEVEVLLAQGNDFISSNFKDGEYLTNKNQVAVYYDMTQAGFNLLMVGFTGKRAQQLVPIYLQAFQSITQQQTKALEQINKPHRQHVQITPHNDTCYITHKEIARVFNLDEQQVKDDIKAVQKMLNQLKLQSPKAFPVSSVRTRQSVAYQAYFLLFVPNTPETLAARLETITSINEYHNNLAEQAAEKINTQQQRQLEHSNNFEQQIEQYRTLVKVMDTELSMLRNMLSDKNKQQMLKQKSLDSLGKSIEELIIANPNDIKLEKINGQFELLISIEAVVNGAMQKDIDRTKERVHSFYKNEGSFLGNDPHEDLEIKDIMLHPLGKGKFH